TAMNLISLANRVELCNFWTGLILNILLIYLIFNVKRSESAYKYLQLSFVLNDIAFATISYVLGDKMIVKGHTFAMFLTSPYDFAASCLSLRVHVLQHSGRGRLQLSLSLLGRHQHPTHSALLHTMVSTFSGPLGNGRICSVVRKIRQKIFRILPMIRYLNCYILYPATEEGRAFVAPEMARKYGLNARTQAVVMADYYRNGEYDMQPIIGVLIFVAIISTGLGFMIFCIVSILRHLSLAKAISARTRRLQYALFRTLIVQTIVPVVFLHANCGNTILSPLFGIDISFMCDWISTACSCFAPFDAIATILLMRDYRATVWS
ncbi:hypothetical protein PMAYCL1PPCAC_16322, partial [Pristionchus mayeri]